MRVALCQLNTVVGDISGNNRRILRWYEHAVEHGAGLVVFPELALIGYPARDLLELPDFVETAVAAARDLAAATGPAGLVFGTPWPSSQARGKKLMNSALFCSGGEILGHANKKLLPTYDVFDESRHFQPDSEPAAPVAFGGIRWGLHICEDAWNEDGFWPRQLYARDPVAELAESGAQVLLNISASPFHARKIPLRRSMFCSHCRRHRLPLLYTNAVGGNDELVFDGEAYVVDASGRLLASGDPFEEEMVLVDLEDDSCEPHGFQSLNPEVKDVAPKTAGVRDELEELEAIRAALVLGFRDYAGKCGFKTAVLGLSGGIDSAVTAALAAQALGAENVYGLSLPSRYSSAGSLSDAEALARNLGIHYNTLSIEEPFTAALNTLEPLFSGTAPGVAEENLQARSRSLLLMALSNKFGHLLLATGNKSELAVGYCTLYGDMAGGLTPISDVPKTTVYALARYLNREQIVIPENTITKPPSAELRPDQTDQDSLPPYDILDRILAGYIEDGKSRMELEAEGLPPETITTILRMVSRAEHKRWQAAPGIKISPKAFGLGRRMPIAKRWPPDSTEE